MAGGGESWRLCRRLAVSVQRTAFAIATMLTYCLGLVGCGGGGGGSSPAESGIALPVLVADLASVTAVATDWANSCAVDLSGRGLVLGRERLRPARL